MSYHSKSDLVRSILKAEAKKAFRSSQPLSAATEKEREQLLERMKDELKSLPLCSLDTYNRGGKEVLPFKILLDAKTVANVNLALSFDKAGCLCLGDWRDREMAKVSAAAEIAAYAEALRKASVGEDRRLEKLAFEADKRQKLRALKRQAIFAKIKSLCETERVDYCIDERYRGKVKLLVRLSKAERLEVDIPYASYQNALQNAHLALQSMRELFAKGVLVKVKSSIYDNNHTRWISTT